MQNKNWNTFSNDPHTSSLLFVLELFCSITKYVQGPTEYNWIWSRYCLGLLLRLSFLIRDSAKKFDKVFFTVKSLQPSARSSKHFFPDWQQSVYKSRMSFNSIFLPYHDFPFLGKTRCTFRPHAFLSGRHLCLQENKPRLTTRYLANRNVPMLQTAEGKTTVIRGSKVPASS